MPDVIFVTGNTESLENESENNNEFRKERHKKGAKKNVGETNRCTFGAKIERKASSRQLKLLLLVILINSLPQCI